MTPLSICRFGFCLLVLSSAAIAADEPAVASKPKMTTGELAAWIDQEFEKEWAASSIAPPAVVDDATFLKRVSLDLTGSIPSVSLARDFLEYSGSHDRGVLVDRFLNERRRPEKFADRTAAHWATLWRRMMVPGNTPQAQMATALEPWIKQQFVENIPYDQFARSLITATNNGQTAMVVPGRPGMEMSATPAMFYQAVGGKPENAASSLTRVFLGTRIGCAECHDHPTAEWKQKDFWGMAAFFSGINNGVVGDVASPKITATTQGNTVEYVGKFLDGREPPATSGKTPRQILADWMVAAENKQFAATAVNRIWLYLLGQGMTEAVDDLDQASPGERRILDELAQKFVESGYDVHWLISGICKSQVYQRECVHADDTDAAPSAGLRVVKALTPEQVFDSLEQALVLPVSRVDGSARFNGLRNQLIARMNEAASNNPGDYKAGIPQALLLMNGRLTAEATDLDQSRTLRGVLDAPFLGTQQKLDTLYLATFSRRPNSDENTFLLDYVQKQTAPDKQNEAFAEIFWGLLNSPEFVLER